MIYPLKGVNPHNIKLISGTKHEPLWLLKKRQVAFHSLTNKLFPDLTPALQNLRLSDLKVYLESKGKIVKNPRLDNLSGYITQSESTGMTYKLNDHLKRNGVILLPLDEARVKHEKLFGQYFDKLHDLSDWNLADLNLSVFSGGMFLYVPAGQKVELPIRQFSMIFSRGMCQFPRNLLILAENSSCRIEDTADAGIWDNASNINCETTEIFVAKGAVCQHEIKQKWQKNLWNFRTVKTSVAEGGNYILKINASDATLSMSKIDIFLNEKNSSCTILNDIIADDLQTIEDEIRIFHNFAQTKSVLNLFTFSRGESKIRQKLMVVHNPTAKNSDAKINSVSCTLSNKSQIAIIPQIQTNCGSAQTVCNLKNLFLSEAQNMYLKTRGLCQREIEDLFIKSEKKIVW